MEIGFDGQGKLILDIIYSLHKIKKSIEINKLSKETIQYTAPELGGGNSSKDAGFGLNK